MFRFYFAIFVGKAARFICRVLHRGGTATPGRAALKICPDLLSRISKDVKCIIITGTNGKTTSTRIVEEGLHTAGFKCFANRSGANLIEGIATDFIVNSGFFGKCRYDYAVLETDEAASKEVCRQLQPKVIFVTNLFRDQVDRFGGVVNTRDNIRIGIENAPDAFLVLNADCPVTSSLAEDVPNKVVFFGISAEASGKCDGKGVTDLSGCIRCGEKYDYSYIVFSHLGGFRCKKCGVQRPAADYEVTDIPEQTLSYTKIKASVPDDENNRHEINAEINLPAVYNIYNALGSFAAMRSVGVSEKDASKALSSFKCGFGRMEKLNIGRKGGRMILVKNDAGCNQVLQFLHTVDEDFVLSIYLNNNVSDGVDITWINDAEFELLNSSKVKKIYVSGLRIKEMTERLKKAQIPEEIIVCQDDCHDLITELNQSTEPVFIMPTYTGMMETRAEIIRQCGGSEFWNG